MATKKKEKPVPVVLDWTLPQILTAVRVLMFSDCIGGDGHGIFSIGKLVESHPQVAPLAGWLKQLERKHKSSGTDPKGVIFNDRGEPLLFLIGVGTLEAHHALARELKVSYLEAYGRGTEARRIQSAVIEKINQIMPLCPRCGKPLLPKGQNAVSRRDNQTQICPGCGVREAMIDVGQEKATPREAEAFEEEMHKRT